MRLLLVGDCHGNRTFLHQAFEYARIKKATTVVQVGDLGYKWPGSNNSIAHKASELVQATGISFYWLDGNHENHEAIDKEMGGRNIYDDWPHELDPIDAPGVYYLPRAATWNWDDINFMSFGGAFSVDKPGRTPYVSWWPEEEADSTEINEALSIGKVDIMLTHDVPWKVDVPGTDDYWKNYFPETKSNRMVLDEIVDHSQPKLLIHGHLHHPYEIDITHPGGKCHVIGLDAENIKAFYLLDTFEFKQQYLGEK